MRILLVQRSLNPPGGGNAVAAWMVHALAGTHDVSTMTASRWDAARTNAFYGTAIPDGRVRQFVVPAPWNWLATLPDHRLNRIRMCSVLRSARPLANDHDVLITADNFGAFPRPGIQYLHFPLNLQPRPWRLAPVVNVYFKFCDFLVGVPWESARNNMTLVNSDWTAAELTKLERIDAAKVLYPPVIDAGAGLPWERRRDTFLCIGRFHGSKRIERAMTIVQRLRAHALPGARLAIVGSAVDPDYTKRLFRFAARDRDWIEFHEDLSRDALNRLMGESRYAIQAMEHEHFGMATAELLRAGCVVFPHRSGGSIEVVGGDDRLLWENEDQAVARIAAIVRDPAARDEIRWNLQHQARRYSPERFAAETLAIVESFYASVRKDASAISA